MNGQDDLSEGQWVAAVALALVLLVPLVTLAAVWIKRRYAHAVVELQASTAADDAAPAAAMRPPHEAALAVARPLELPLGQAAEARGDAPHAAQPALRLRRRVLALQFALGFAYWVWLVLAVGVAMAFAAGAESGASETPTLLRARVSAHLLFWPLLLAPPAMAWAVQAGVAERKVWIGFGAFGLAWALGLGLDAHTPPWTALALAGGLVLVGAMLGAFLRPSARGAGPPLTAATIVGWLVLSAMAALLSAFEQETSADDWPTSVRAWATLALQVAAVLLPALWAGRWTLRRIARRYGEKRFSEVQLALAAYWGLITALSISLASMIAFADGVQNAEAAGEWMAIVMLAGWWLWRLVQRLALRLVVRKASPALPPLLFLRVFKPSQRSEAFTDRLLARWRFAGPVWMIAGPDLAGAYMEPDEFFAYLGRRLHERCITRREQIAPRIAALDGERDPDGRFRVNDLCCSNTTWQSVVRELMGRAGAVLLDMREYTGHRAGTRFELAELLRRAPLAKVLLVAGAGQDIEHLRTEVQAVWAEVGAARADEAGTAPLTLQVLRLDDSDAALEGLIATLARASRE